MLKLFRQKKLGVKLLLFVIVGMVGAAMLVYLVPGAGGDTSLRDPQGLLAQVGDEPVTQAEVQQRFERAAQQLGAQSPQFRQVIMGQLVEELIAQRVVAYEAVRLGLRVTPEEIAARLRQIPDLFPGGQFVGMETYRQLVQQQFRMSVPQFERLLAQEVVTNKAYQWVTAGLTVSEAEIEQEYRRRSEQVEVEFALFAPDTFAQQVEPTEEELRAFFESRRDRYQLPARRAVRFVALDYALLNQRVTISPRELEAEYQARRELYQLPEQVKARHILFLRRRPGQPEAAAAAVRQKAEGVLAELRRGKDFAALARQHSDDAGSRDKGGEIGWVRRGQAVPALEQALFSLPAGGPAQLVETNYGFHLVQVIEHQPERVKPLAEVRGEIEPLLKADKVRQVALESARRIVAAVRGGKTLDQAAQEAGWPVQESPLFRKDELFGAFGGSREFQEVAFSLPTESAGQPGAPVSDPVAVPPGYVVMQLKQESPARSARFEEVRDQVAATYRQERGAEAAREAARQVAEQAAKAGSLRGAERLGGTVKMGVKFGREGFVPDLGQARDVAPTAFSLPAGGVSQPLSVGGKWVVLRVLARQEADLAKLTDPERKLIQGNVLNQKHNLAWLVFQESAKKRLLAEGKLKLNQAAIDRLVGPG